MSATGSLEAVMPPGRTAGHRPGTDRKYVTALARGLEVLRCFGPDDRCLANQEIAARTGLAKPTVSRLKYTLVRTGHLRHSRKNNKYALGSAAHSLGFASLAQMDVRRTARPKMQDLARHARGSVHLSVRHGFSMVLIDSYQHDAAPLSMDIGVRVPMATTSVGRAYLFALTTDDRRALLAELRQGDLAEWSRLTKVLDRAEADFESRGFSISIGEWKRGVVGVAVPLRMPDAPEPVVFSFSGALHQIDAETIRDHIGPRLLELADDVRFALEAE
jgi:DNA-binding IclR family transcriptional regulator